MRARRKFRCDSGIVRADRQTNSGQRRKYAWIALGGEGAEEVLLLNAAYEGMGSRISSSSSGGRERTSLPRKKGTELQISSAMFWIVTVALVYSGSSLGGWVGLEVMKA